MATQRLDFVRMPLSGPDQQGSSLLPQHQTTYTDSYSADCPARKHNWKEFTDPKKWGKRLRNLFIAGGVIMSVLFLFELIVAAIGHCGADIVTTTDYTLWDTVGLTFKPTLEDKGTCPICAIWATAYFVSAVAFFIMVAAWDRVWRAITLQHNAGAFWCFQAMFCAFSCMAIFMLLGVSNIMLLVAVFLIALIIPILNALAMIMAAKHDVTGVSATGTSAPVKTHMNPMRTVMIFIFIIAGILFLALVAFAWAYFANLIYGDGSLHVAGYVYFMICWKMAVCIAVAIVNVRFAHRAQKKKSVDSIPGRIVETAFINGIIVIIAAGGLFLGQTIGVHV